MSKGVYIGVAGKARKVKNIYIGVGGKARKVKKAYIGVAGKARLIYSAWNGELYSAGDEFTDVTGGWMSAADPRCVYYDEVVFTSKAPTITKNTADLTIELTGNIVSGTVRTTNRIDLTDYSTITINGTLGRGSGYTNTTTHPFIVLYAQYEMGTDKYYNTNAAAKVTLGNGTTTLDISSLSGEYYVALGFYSNASYPVKYVMTSCVMS